MNAARAMSSEFIEWAKLRSHAPFNLATSGVAAYSLLELGATLDDLELSGPHLYGYEPLQQALAAKCGVKPECLVAAIGTSMANYLAMAATLEPSDDVLIEHPAYDPVLGIASHLGANIVRFERRFENHFGIDPDEVARRITPRTRLSVLTTLHNPSGALADDATLRAVGEIAQRAGARVLVDEVYLEMPMVEAPQAAPRSAFHLGDHFLVTSSLTKAYGLSGLRCGWILAEPQLAHRIWRLNDLMGNIPAHPAERLSVIALQRLPQVAQRAKNLLGANRALLEAFLDSRSDLQTFRAPFGTVVFPRWLEGDAESLCRLLREKYQTTVVPGRFFEMPEHFRIGIGGDTAQLAEGLRRLAAGLDELK